MIDVQAGPATPHTIATARQAIVSKELSAADLAQSYYATIAEEDKHVYAWLALSKERALSQAARIDEKVKRGEELPPLAGVPIGIKDVLTMQGVPATAGSKILERYIPPYDATVVARLEAAGAVLLGKLNCDEFAMGSSNENSAYGPVHNPRDLSRVPGGSSGGSAAAVAANMAIATLGTDTGGSIRQPASFCGVVGLLPTYGRVSRYGLIAFASSLDRVGPFTHTVEDAATLLGILAGHDPMDATSATGPVPNYAGAVEQPVKGMRVGIPEEYFSEGLDVEVRAAVEKAADALRSAGCILQTVSLPHTQYAIPAYYVLATAEASANLARFDGVRYGLRASGATSLNAMYRQSRDAGFGKEVKRRILLGTYVLSAGYYDAYYRKAQQVRTLLTRDFFQAFRSVDALLTPTAPTPAFLLGEKTDDPLSMYLADIYTVTANLAGICGISVPCGNSSQGLSIGAQILGGHFQEATVLRLARVIERAQ